MSSTDQSPAADPAAPAISPGYARYALAVLLGVYIFNFIDRNILSILLEDIRKEIELSDTQLGFLGGIAFALFYTFAGIPIARWADRGSRVNIVAVSVLIWSLMTAFTGAAKSFWTLLAARIGVGIGEAGCSPPAHSLISDYFPPERRATALSIYALGIPIGGALGTLVGGWVTAWFGWRMAFVAVGLPGVLIALLVRLTLKEPPRGGSEAVVVGAAPPNPDGETALDVLRFMGQLRSFWHLAFAGALHALVGYGAAFFVPSFFARVHGMGLEERATWISMLGLIGAIGTFLGGALADRYGPRDVRWFMWIPATATLAGVPIALGYYLVPDPYVALAIGVLAAIAGPMYLGPSFATTQTLVRPEMRAMAAAILLFVLNLIGLGIGPWFVGYLSDLLVPSYGDESIRYSLVWVVTIGNAWAAVHYFIAARTLKADLAVRDS
jgi:MFS family permease